VDPVVSLWQTILVACVPALVGVGGVLATVVVSTRQERARWDNEDRHERELDAERFMRQERRAEYARIITLTREALSSADSAMRSADLIGANHELTSLAMSRASEVGSQWRSAWAEVDLVASRLVNECLSEVDGLLTSYEQALTAAVFTDPDGVMPGDIEPRGPSLAQGIELVERLVEAARADLGPQQHSVDRSAEDGAGGAARRSSVASA
jgi:hypothetical protein